MFWVFFLYLIAIFAIEDCPTHLERVWIILDMSFYIKDLKIIVYSQLIVNTQLLHQYTVMLSFGIQLVCFLEETLWSNKACQGFELDISDSFVTGSAYKFLSLSCQFLVQNQSNISLQFKSVNCQMFWKSECLKEPCGPSLSLLHTHKTALKGPRACEHKQSGGKHCLYVCLLLPDKPQLKIQQFQANILCDYIFTRTDQYSQNFSMLPLFLQTSCQ